MQLNISLVKTEGTLELFDEKIKSAIVFQDTIKSLNEQTSKNTYDLQRYYDRLKSLEERVN
jgi:hypothetical protein